jgi:gas vesicle protein
VNDDRTAAVMIGGAVVGALAAYLFFTERGRALRSKLEPALEDFAREVGRFQGDVQRALTVATDGWGAITNNERVGRTH